MSLRYFFSKFMKKIQISAIKNSNLHRTSRVASKSHLVGVFLGKYSYIGNNCTVLNTDIGNYCSVADNTVVGGASHPINWVSSSPVFHEGKNILRKNFSTHRYHTTKKTKIGHDVWIGNNCLIKSGVEIGNGAIIGMGSVLTKNVGPYEIWAGNPAKFVRKRFDNDVIDTLQKSNWWLWSDNEIESYAHSFHKPKEFFKSYEKEVNL